MSGYLSVPTKRACLKIALMDDSLKEKYTSQISMHNRLIESNPFADSGFDLFMPDDILLSMPEKHDFNAQILDMKIKCEMVDDEGNSIAYYIYPRSSISKTPLMLANNGGIIDSGYRGNIKIALRNLMPKKNYRIEQHVRLTQICLPSLGTFNVKLVNVDDLSVTVRGGGGFGSTGI